MNFSRYQAAAFDPILARLDGREPPGISFWERKWVSSANSREPKLWGRNAFGSRAIFIALLLLWFALMGLALSGGPHGMYTMAPLPMMLLFFPALSVYRILIRRSRIKQRGTLSLDDFAEECGLSAKPPQLISAVRSAISNSYRVSPESIFPWDTERSLRPFAGTIPPYAFEVILGTTIQLGKSIRDEDVDRIAQKLKKNARSVKDVVSIVADELEKF